MTVVSRYIEDHPLALAEFLALYVVVVVLDGAGLWIAAILTRSPAGGALGREVAQLLADQATDTALSIQRIEQARSQIRQTRKAARADDALHHIREEMSRTSCTVATAEGEQMRRIAPLLACAGSMNAMVEASVAMAEATRRAHERNAILGELADSMIENAARQALKGAKT